MLLILLFRHESEVDQLKSVRMQAAEELHMQLETPARNRTKKAMCVQAPVGLHGALPPPPAAADVGETHWQFPTADQLFAGVGMYARSNCSLYTTNRMLPTGFKSVDTNRCVCQGQSHASK
ncbi:hypothetical protein AVEN_74962-1 [Araneus ventricosus]|uniref:Uncharacterized protein n=1 Tax=Araneus ventricosus TaxID=182803 RepID=A0A4Y2M771_ARAVE|nr:hypothetical protein AVEN_74962-1 [Araneus ventricosus]